MNENKANLKQLLKGTAWAVIIALSLVLKLALVVNFTGMGGSALNITTQIIKILSIFIGVRILLGKITGNAAYMYGILLGVLYTTMQFFIFAIINTDFAITAGFLFEIMFATSIALATVGLIKFGKRKAL